MTFDIIQYIDGPLVGALFLLFYKIKPDHLINLIEMRARKTLAESLAKAEREHKEFLNKKSIDFKEKQAGLDREHNVKLLKLESEFNAKQHKLQMKFDDEQNSRLDAEKLFQLKFSERAVAFAIPVTKVILYFSSTKKSLFVVMHFQLLYLIWLK
ncbi:MAG: hypothetical protein HRT87_11030 [Legionellales bacterium]|nr:hypothetical protein [Legionellales bacterium]